jgi:hypothetical protein
MVLGHHLKFLWLTILFYSNLGSSSWFNIEKSYYSQNPSTGQKVYTTGPLTLGKYITNNYSNGKTLTINTIVNIIYNAMKVGKLPYDSNGIYVLLSSPDVTEGSFCSQYCGYHSYFTAGTTNYQFSFVGNPAQCPYDCISYNYNTSPNGNIGVDGLASILAHEIVETMSDPLLDAWWDANGEENADKCSWDYGTTSQTSTGAYYNIAVGVKKFLMQQNWNANTQACALSA